MMTGFDGLVNSSFGGDYEAARKWTAALGRASYFRFMKPGLSLGCLLPYQDKFPHLFIREIDGQVTGINWKNRRLKQKSRRRGLQIKSRGYICE